jgi:hypothetical protein
LRFKLQGGPNPLTFVLLLGGQISSLVARLELPFLSLLIWWRRYEPRVCQGGSQPRQVRSYCACLLIMTLIWICLVSDGGACALVQKRRRPSTNWDPTAVSKGKTSVKMRLLFAHRLRVYTIERGQKRNRSHDDPDSYVIKERSHHQSDLRTACNFAQATESR